MRKTCLDSVYEIAKTDPRVFFIGSDLGIGTLKQFKAEMPDRFFMEGVSEANLIGISAGLALEGKKDQQAKVREMENRCASTSACTTSTCA